MSEYRIVVRDGFEVVGVGSDKREARALRRAREAGVPAAVFPREEFADRIARDQAMGDWIEGLGPDLVALAGYIQLLSPGFVGRFRDRIVNVHPALLPAFPGLDAVGQALDAGGDVTGVTVHFVDEGVDTGAPILQREVPVPKPRDREELENALHAVEHAKLRLGMPSAIEVQAQCQAEIRTICREDLRILYPCRSLLLPIRREMNRLPCGLASSRRRPAGTTIDGRETNMLSRKLAFGLAIMCALAISAVAVASASATSAFTCEKNASGTLKGAHCLATGPSETYKHTSFTGSTSFTVTNANTASETTAAAISVLAGSLSGVATELQCTTMSGTGTLENTGTVAKGTGTITYTGCTVLKPSGKGCKVKGETINTKSLAAETSGAANLKYKPASGEEFAAIVIEGCSVGALNNTFPVTGSLVGTVNGGTTTTTEAGVTTQENLKFGGNRAGLGGAWTTRGPNGNGFALT